MARPLRLPKSWNDKGLLEDAPFHEVFFQRKFVPNGPTSNRRRSDDWVQRLAKQIKAAPELRAAALAWSSFAFAPEPEDTTQSLLTWRSQATVEVDPASLKAIEVFVNFYWAWYADGPRFAQQVVDVERKRRMFGWCLPDIEGDLADNLNREITDIPPPGRLQPACGVQRRSSPADTSTSDNVAGPTTLGPLDVSGEAADPVMALDMTTFEKQLEQDDADGEDKDDVVVFADNHDVAAYLAQATPFEEATQPNIDLRSEEASSTADGSSTLWEVFFSDSPLTTLSELSDDEYQEPCMEAKPHLTAGKTDTTALRSNHKVEQGLKPSSPRPTHAAYHKKSKRRLNDAPPDTRHAGSAVVVNNGRRNPRKRSKLRAPDLTSPSPLVGKSPRPPPPLHTHPGAAASSSQPPRPRNGGIFYGSEGKKGKKKTRRRLSRRSAMGGAGEGDGHATQREAKRQRGEDGPNAIDALNEAIRAQQPRRNPPRGSQQRDEQLAGAVGRGPTAPIDYSTGSAATMSTSRKRPLEEGIPATHADRPGPSSKGERKVAKLPKSGRKRLRDTVVMAAPRPSSTSLGIPANLGEADRMLSSLGKEALVGLQDTTPQADAWPADGRARDERPPSDDEEDEDDEDEVAVFRRVIPGPPWRPAPHRKEPEGQKERIVLKIKIPAGYKTPSLPSTAVTPLASGGPVLRTSTTPAPVVVSDKPLLPKRPLTAQPIIWAKSRQEVCESFDWFRSYQGGVYFNSDIAKGYLLGGFSARRDLFARNGRLIISHGGGKAESVHSQKGVPQLHEASDQQEGDKSVRALLRTHHMKRPIALLIDDRYALFPFDLAAKKDCTYAVLGFYHIAHAWAERQPADNDKGHVVRWKFAFEWCEKQPAPWWEDRDAAAKDRDDDKGTSSPRPGVVYRSCAACTRKSPLVYQEGWMCLTPQCTAFWTLQNGTRPPEKLTYAESFLSSRMHCDHDPLEDIAPILPATGAGDGVVTSRRFSKGWHCKQCGRLSSRFKWQHWECQNCGTTLTIAGATRLPKECCTEVDRKFLDHLVLDPAIKFGKLDPYPVPEANNFGHYRVYVLPKCRGKIYVIQGRPPINQIADEIFREYQEQAKSGDLQFRRFPLKSHQCRGELLTNYFSQNSGEPYQYIGGTGNTVPFDAAPSAVIKARDLIHNRMMSVMQAENGNPYRFNEVLSAAYMEEQSMSFHSDAEVGLGPRVASLSLGSSAYMHFRLHKKYRTDGGSGNMRNSLTLFLRHGDVLIMDGAAIQEYYEHTVVPLNFRIAATARYIGGSTPVDQESPMLL